MDPRRPKRPIDPNQLGKLDTTTQTDKPETIEIPEGTSTAKHN
jgi:hypothetical protein